MELWGVSNVCLFSPLFVKDSHFDKYFSDGLKPPAKHGSIKSQNASHRRFFAATGGEDVKR